jgi:hypothetical protein
MDFPNGIVVEKQNCTFLPLVAKPMFRTNSFIERHWPCANSSYVRIPTILLVLRSTTGCLSFSREMTTTCGSIPDYSLETGSSQLSNRSHSPPN